MRHVLALALIALPAPLFAQQSADVRDVMTRAIRAYQDLDFDVATTLLRRVLSGDADDSTRIRALTYLGAAEHYGGHADSAAAAFRRLIVLAPVQRPDTLVFPPEITRLYDDVLSRTQVGTVLVPAAPPRAEAAPTDTPPHPPPRPTEPVPVRATDAAGFAAGLTATAAGTVASVRARSSGGLPPASGTVLGMALSARYRRFELGVRYQQGSLQTRDLVEGAATLRFGATPWLTLQAGPQIRRYDMPAGAERWVTWRVGARAEAPVLGPSVRTHALLWRGLGLSVNVPPGSGVASGGEVGLRVDAPGPLWFGLAYLIDQASLGNGGGGRRETVASLIVTAGMKRRM